MGEQKVRIGIPVPTTGDADYNARFWPQYAEAVVQAGGEPVRIELGLESDRFAEKLERCAGFVLPGSPADVDPAGYGQEREPATARADVPREACDRALLQEAALQGKPVLAICFGAQMLNVWCGGALVQDLAPVPVNHAAGSQVAVAHSVWVSNDSLLASLLSGTEAPKEGEHRRLAVNSSHHQAIRAPGRGLAVVARSLEDQVVEAVEGRVGEATMLGVQWHPERSTEISAGSRALFSWVVGEALDRQQHATWDGDRGRDL